MNVTQISWHNFCDKFVNLKSAVLKIPGLKKALGVPNIPVPPPGTAQNTPAFSLLEAIKKAAAASRPKIPAPVSSSADQAKPVDGKTTSSSSSTSSSAVLSQRLKSLERQVKQKKKNKKRWLCSSISKFYHPDFWYGIFINLLS